VTVEEVNEPVIYMIGEEPHARSRPFVPRSWLCSSKISFLKALASGRAPVALSNFGDLALCRSITVAYRAKLIWPF